MVDTYAKIAEEAFGHFLNEKARSESIVISQADSGSMFDHEDRNAVYGIQTIVFSAMAIEAAVFDFAAIQLGDKIAERYLDKMDLLSKWMIVPRLVCGRSLQEDGPAMNGLKGLVIARNALVHHKSREWDIDGKAEQAMHKRWESFEKDQVPNAFKTLILLSLELDALLETTIGPLPGFEKELYAATPRAPLVEKVVQRCREIHNKNWEDA
jgi:hypothetical protein